MSVTRVQAIWNGFVGSPGYSNFYFGGVLDAAGLNAAALAVRNLFNNIGATGADYIPTGTTIAINPTASVFSLQGELEEEKPITSPPAAAAGSGSGNYAGGAGAVIIWKTGSVVHGRKLNGRTFLVPLTGAFEANGTLSSTAVTRIGSAAQSLITAMPSFCIQGNNRKKGEPATEGWSANVVAFTVPDRSAFLRSRRT